MTFRALAKVSSIGDQGWQRDRPLLALVLHFITQVEDNLPVLTSQSLICRFRFFEEEERMGINVNVGRK